MTVLEEVETDQALANRLLNYVSSRELGLNGMESPSSVVSTFKLNKKLKRLARIPALSYKAKDNQIVVIEDFNMTNPKTSEFVGLLKALNVTGRSLFVTPDTDKNVYLSGRNIEGNTVMRAADLNTYEVLKASSLILTESSISKIEETNKK